MASILDLMFSLVIGFVIVGIIIAATVNVSDEAAVQTHDVQLMESLLSTLQVMESDMRNIGSGVPDSVLMVSAASASAISFRQIRNRSTGKVDTVSYYLGTTAELSKTENPQDRYLYRQINNLQPEKVGLVTEMSLGYMTAPGAVLPLPVPSDRLSEISAVHVTMEVQSQHGLTDGVNPSGPKKFPSARIVNRRFDARNLKR